MAQVRWSLTAGNDLQDIEDYIARDSVLHSITFVDRMVESAETLLKTPQIGRMVPEFNRPDLRELIFRGYRIVYLLQGDEALSFESCMVCEIFSDLSVGNLGRLVVSYSEMTSGQNPFRVAWRESGSSGLFGLPGSENEIN